MASPTPLADAPNDGAVVGHVAALWRFPLKSMLGERLERLEVEARGVVGDRGYALWDGALGRVASAKNPRRWGALLPCRARYLAEPRAGVPRPPRPACAAMIPR